MEYKKILLAVSGGPDSMYMLNKYKHLDVVVAYINYNQREDSYLDEQIVTDFCNKNKIKLEKLVLNKSDYISGNFQDWAREKRFIFFKEIYYKYNRNILYIAHNLDDYLETAQMQLASNRTFSLLGIRKKSYLFNMNIYRPFLFRYFKDTILKKCKKYNIPFHIDYTNNQNKYLRNIQRNKNKLLSKFQKILILINIYLKNRKIHKNNQITEKEYKIWLESNFAQEIFRFFLNKQELIYKFIHLNFDNIELSSKKIQAIEKFILSNNRTSEFKLNDKNKLRKKKGKIIAKE
ncbi:tRNA lysidine(34) synthetase TilS [Mycoplasma sp. 6243]|uniref:tRNA lysidine(34) synthetase TilS n=1 Tax=Mycoplasma sp. 6243 TaxID=3440865 RepID=UPI003EBE6BE4